jgi:dTDP-4-dehydrorhamnose 3,5-epimerase
VALPGPVHLPGLMKVSQTSIPDVLILEPKVYTDHRGFFLESYQKLNYTEVGLPNGFVQDNHSGSKQGVLRGLHYQIRQVQGKLIWVVSGEIYDVVVDLRRSSPTFGHWLGMQLSAESRMQLWVPPGLAHGFYVLSDWAEVIYKATDYYVPEWERTLLWNDPHLGIEWHLLDDQAPIVSEKDAQGKLLCKADTFN